MFCCYYTITYLRHVYASVEFPHRQSIRPLCDFSPSSLILYRYTGIRSRDYANRFFSWLRDFLDNWGCSGLSLPAARSIMAAIPQIFYSLFSAALSLTSRSVNFGTQIGFFEFCVPAGRCLSSRSRSTLAHKSAFSSFVCQVGSASGNFRRKKWEIFGTQIA